MSVASDGSHWRSSGSDLTRSPPSKVVLEHSLIVDEHDAVRFDDLVGKRERGSRRLADRVRIGLPSSERIRQDVPVVIGMHGHIAQVYDGWLVSREGLELI